MRIIRHRCLCEFWCVVGQKEGDDQKYKSDDLKDSKRITQDDNAVKGGDQQGIGDHERGFGKRTIPNRKDHANRCRRIGYRKGKGIQNQRNGDIKIPIDDQKDDQRRKADHTGKGISSARATLTKFFFKNVLIRTEKYGEK